MNDLSVPERAKGWEKRPDKRNSEKMTSLADSGRNPTPPTCTPMDQKPPLFPSTLDSPFHINKADSSSTRSGP